MAYLTPEHDPRIRSFSIACPAEVTQRKLSSATSARRGSRALDVRGAKSGNSLWKWVQEHVDKQLIGLGINFLILIVLLLLLKVFVQWIQMAQLAAREMRSGGGGGAANPAAQN